MRQYLEDNDVHVRNVGEDYIEALVPPALLPTASELPGVRRVDTVIPSQPHQSQGNTVSQGVSLHQVDRWHRMGYRGQGIKVGIIDSGFEGFGQRQGSELPPQCDGPLLPAVGLHGAGELIPGRLRS